jgi:hypothetical protein
MKRLFLFAVTILFVTTLWGQQRETVIMSEDFSSGSLPTGWAADSHSSNWFLYNGNSAGGEAPELIFYWDPQFDATSRMVTSVYDLSSYSTVVLSFKQYLSDYSGGYTIGVATSSDGGTTWNIVWSASPSGDIAPQTKDIVISNSDVNANFQFCFFFSGNSYNVNHWHIDDIVLYAPENFDLSLSSINNKHYFVASEQTISATVKNIGSTAITSFDINYQIDNNTPVTESVTGVNIALTDVYDYNFTQTWTATTGDYDLKVWISNINGGNDDVSANDTLTFDFHVASQNKQRTVLYEEFTSSTCSPCATFNSQYFNTTFLDNNEGKFTLIKYQMSWPSPGDPYYTAEGGVRRTYYGVNGVPTLMIDAEEGTLFNSTDLQNDLDNHYANPAFFDIDATYSISGDNISVDADITPYVNATNFTVQIAVVEKTTTQNVGNNGETEFHYVMMKMLPDADGTQTNFAYGTTFSISESYDMSSTNVEEMDDLAVVVFVQNDDTHEVFQSAFATLVAGPTTVSFSPADGATNIPVDTNIVITFSDSVRFVDNSEITNDNIANFVSISSPDKADIAFTASIDADKKVITLDPNEDLPYATEITVTLTGSDIENNSDVALADTSITFTTINGAGLIANQVYLRIYPNPASQYVNVKCQNGSEIVITDLTGKIIKQTIATGKVTSIDVQGLNAGVYLLQIKNNRGTKSQRLIIK